MPMRDTRAPLFASQFRQTNVIEKDAYVLPSHPSIHGSKAKQNARALVVVGVNALLAAANRSVPTLTQVIFICCLSSTLRTTDCRSSQSIPSLPFHTNNTHTHTHHEVGCCRPRSLERFEPRLCSFGAQVYSQQRHVPQHCHRRQFGCPGQD